MGLFTFIARWFREEPMVLPPDPLPMDQPIPEAAFAALQSAVWSPDARVTVEFCSGTPIWEDENYDEFAMACMTGRCDRWQDLFHHRLFLITGQRNEFVDHDRCFESWMLVTANCPDWPGLRVDRTTPAIRQHIEGVLAEAMASL